MEVGAVKQAFNNEVILLKKNLSQAKIQIIHKLTRKAKQLTEKKAPEKLQEKLKRKAESAVKEVLVIKKIKPKDIAKFIVTHKGELNSFLNKPQVDEDKACARLLLHKALQEKYKFIRGRFSNVPIKDLFMSRLERRKMKKEAKEKQKNKKKDKNSKVVNSEGDWDVEDVGDKRKLDDDEGNEMSGDDEGNEMSGDDEGNDMSGDDDMSSDDNGGNGEFGDESDQSDGDGVEDEDETKDLEEDNDLGEEPSDSELKEDSSKILKQTAKAKPAVVANKTKAKKTEVVSPKTVEPKEIKNPKPQKEIVKKNPIKKQKDLNKTKNFNEKILQKKLKKDSDGPVVEKIVDPFFITSTGENYMSVVEPRAPDEIKDEHMQGNRKLRRAVMFGHVPKSRLRQNNNYHNEDNRFNKQNGYDRGNNYKGKFNDRPQFNDRRNFNDKKSFNNDFNDRRNFNDRKSFNNDFNDKRGFNRNDKVNEEPEKLHPSWEAKRKKSGILPFEGKKIVFDES
ncbi:serum response factor-binding protein 1 [Helicoverpa armigera]|uniref:serum response factor-binding protein 1 n=1 Tax=Helicoverpa armigera TaxID=29058 RepID=UPI0030834B8F